MTNVDGIPHGASSGYTRWKCRCDPCKAWKSANDRAYREANKDALRERKRAYYFANADSIKQHYADYRANRSDDQRKRDAEYHRQWAAEAYADGRPRSDATKARRKQRDNERRDVIRATEIAYRLANTQKRRDWEANRRARKNAADIRRVTDADWIRVLDHYRQRCAYCGCGGTMTQDHIIPLIRGGRHAIGNLIPACGSCNSSKNGRLLIEWRASRRLL